ncbi:EGF family domain-containing protein [Besnoitia besnoiti]|uniref:EGF family domain-containing protein n=1 Tax=Besnoitia besnoiti TaxID=94643 RepID=A0A2A9M9F4_BESBE|nr:EGF family domain-containing protein [Besnoitia besnoiti]PFH32951.1 EGF family domain-containing protein [Besnoitia besnoiti]
MRNSTEEGASASLRAPGASARGRGSCCHRALGLSTQFSVSLFFCILGSSLLDLWHAPQSASAAITLPPQAQWVCRISERNQRCADVYANEHTGQKGGICREDDCCSRTGLSPSMGFGDVCKPRSDRACGSYKDAYSYGKCDLTHQCHKCSTASKCKLDNSENGGVWCHCPAPGVGDGISCVTDPCKGSPCDNGTCSPRKDDPNDYQCACYPGFTAVKDSTGAVKACVDTCATNVCGEGALACYNGQAGHVCACGDGYVNMAVNGSDTCVKPDFCLVNPCGDASAVKSCETVSTTEYKCTCNLDHELATNRNRPFCRKK